MNAIETIENALAYYTVGAKHLSPEVTLHNQKIAHALEWLHAQWQPVPDGEYFPSADDVIEVDGNKLSVTQADKECGDFSYTLAEVVLPDDLRLCRKVT